MLKEIAEIAFFNNTVLDYFIFLGLIIGGFIAVKIFQHVILKRLKRLAEKTATTLDDFLVSLIQSIALPLAYFVVFYLCVNTLELDPIVQKVIDIVLVAIMAAFAARLAIAVIGHGIHIYWLSRGKDEGLKRSLAGITRLATIIIWGLAVTFFLDNLGFKISAVIAGLGIGGVAVALAAQAILGDLFSYFSIIFDRPFEAGDFIIIGDFLGTIEHIGIKTTRVRSLGGEQLIFSNTDLTSSRVRNYKKMQKRRVVFKIGVTYQTPLEKLKVMPGVLENVIKSVKDTAFDRAHFSSYGDFSLIFEIVYYVLSPNYNKYMDTQQEINFAINEEFKKRGIEFAYPTQTLYVNKG